MQVGYDTKIILFEMWIENLASIYGKIELSKQFKWLIQLNGEDNYAFQE